jgi:hypothetical protein
MLARLARRQHRVVTVTVRQLRACGLGDTAIPAHPVRVGGCIGCTAGYTPSATPPCRGARVEPAQT